MKEPILEVGYGAQIKPVDPVLSVALNEERELQGIQVTDDGNAIIDIGPINRRVQLPLMAGELDKSVYSVGEIIIDEDLNALKAGEYSHEHVFNIALAEISSKITSQLHIDNYVVTDWSSTGIICQTTTGYARMIRGDGTLSAIGGNGNANLETQISLVNNSVTMYSFPVIYSCTSNGTPGGGIVRFTGSTKYISDRAAKTLRWLTIYGFGARSFAISRYPNLEIFQGSWFNVLDLRGANLVAPSFTFFEAAQAAQVVDIRGCKHHSSSLVLIAERALLGGGVSFSGLVTAKYVVVDNLNGGSVNVSAAENIKIIGGIVGSVNIGATGTVINVTSKNSTINNFTISGTVLEANSVLIDVNMENVRGLNRYGIESNSVITQRSLDSIPSDLGKTAYENDTNIPEFKNGGRLLVPLTNDLTIDFSRFQYLTQITLIREVSDAVISTLSGVKQTLNAFNAINAQGFTNLNLNGYIFLSWLFLESCNSMTHVTFDGAFYDSEIYCGIEVLDCESLQEINIGYPGLYYVDITGNSSLASIRGIGFSGSKYTGYESCNISNNNLSAEALNQFYTDISPAKEIGVQIAVYGNHGADDPAHNPSIATAKGYIVIT